MSDFQIFGVAASDAQIKNIYEAGGAQTVERIDADSMQLDYA